MDWWHEDPELLSATLYLLASADDDALGVSTSTVSDSSISTTDARPPSSPPSSIECNDETPRPASRTTKPAPRVVNVSRERRRDETRYLRAKVAELEAQLSILQHRREQQLRPHLTPNGEIRSVAAVWEALATRQVRELKRSELLNAKLKTMVANQLRVAEDLLAAIRRAEDESQRQRDDADGLIPLARPRLAIDISQQISEEDQLARLDVLCTQWRQAFAACSKFTDGTSLRFFDMTLVADHGDEAIVDVFGSWAAPFAVDKVEDVFWKFYLEECAEDDKGWFAQQYEARDDDNTIIGVFHAASTIESHRTTFDGKYVGKRLRCPQGRMLIVSHMYSEPRCKSNLLDDIAVEEDSWTRIVDAQAVGGPPMTYPLTLLQHARRMSIRFGPRHRPQHETDDADDATEARRRVGALTEFLMLQVEDEMKRGEQCIENMLLESFSNMAVV